MQILCGRYMRAALLFAMFGVLLTRAAGAAASCTDLPPSTLRIYDIKMPVLEELQVPAEAINRMPPADELGSRHTFMLTSSDLVTLLEVRHRIVPQADGS